MGKVPMRIVFLLIASSFVFGSGLYLFLNSPKKMHKINASNIYFTLHEKSPIKYYSLSAMDDFKTLRNTNKIMNFYTTAPDRTYRILFTISWALSLIGLLTYFLWPRRKAHTEKE